MYADSITASMKETITEISRRREKQEEYNEQHFITPKSIQKGVLEYIVDAQEEKEESPSRLIDKKELLKEISSLTLAMQQAAEELRFEEAAAIRDEIARLKKTI